MADKELKAWRQWMADNQAAQDAKIIRLSQMTPEEKFAEVSAPLPVLAKKKTPTPPMDRAMPETEVLANTPQWWVNQLNDEWADAQRKMQSPPAPPQQVRKEAAGSSAAPSMAELAQQYNEAQAANAAPPERQLGAMRRYARSYKLEMPENRMPMRSLATSRQPSMDGKADILMPTEAEMKLNARSPEEKFADVTEPPANPPGRMMTKEQQQAVVAKLDKEKPGLMKVARDIRDTRRGVEEDNRLARIAESPKTLREQGEAQAAQNVADTTRRSDINRRAFESGMTGEQLDDHLRDSRSVTAGLRAEIAKMEAAKERAENFAGYGEWAAKRNMAKNPEQVATMTPEERANVIVESQKQNTTEGTASNAVAGIDAQKAGAARLKRAAESAERQSLVKEKAQQRAYINSLRGGYAMLPPGQDSAFMQALPSLIAGMSNVEAAKVRADADKEIAKDDLAAKTALTPRDQAEGDLATQQRLDQLYPEPDLRRIAGGSPSPLSEFGVDGPDAASLIRMARQGNKTVGNDLARVIASNKPNMTKDEVAAAVERVLREIQKGSAWADDQTVDNPQGTTLKGVWNMMQQFGIGL